MAVGLAGVAILVGGRAGGAGAAAGAHLMVGRLALILASLSWVSGSLWSRAVAAPRSVGARVGDGDADRQPAPVRSPPWGTATSPRSIRPRFRRRAWAALAYLIVFGSLAGFGSYVFLLVHEGPARTSTNAFVNPLIAVALGAALAGEPLGPRTFVAAGMIVAAVAGVILGTAKR